MAALEVFKEVGKLCDREIIATEVLPILWTMALGPLLNLQQFQGFMNAIKTLSSRIEQEQTRKLSELATPDATNGSDFLSFGGVGNGSSSGDGEIDFERLVLGKANDQAAQPFDGGWGSSSHTPQRNASPAVKIRQPQIQSAAKFSWSTPSPVAPTTPVSHPTQPTQTTSSLSAFTPMAPTNRPSSTPSAGFGSTSAFRQPQAAPPVCNLASTKPSINWSTAAKPAAPSYTSMPALTPQPVSRPQLQASNSYSIPAPSSQQQQSGHPTILYGQTRMAKEPPKSQDWGAFALPPPPSASAARPQPTAPNYSNASSMNALNSAYSGGIMQPQQSQQQTPQQQPKNTLSSWESLL